MPKNSIVEDVKPSGLVIDIKGKNSLVSDTKPKNSSVFGATQAYYLTLQAGQSMGLLLALTYPIDEYGELRP